MRLFFSARNTSESKPSSADQLLSVLTNTQCVAWFDMDGTVLEANALYCDMMGYDASALPGTNHSAWQSPNTRAKPALDAALKGEFPKAAIEQRITGAGAQIWVQSTFSVLNDSDGNPVKVCEIAQDVTAQQETTQEQLSQYDAMCKASAKIVFDLQGNILDANENFLSTMGYEADEVIGKHHSIFVHPEYAGSTKYKSFWNGITTGTFQTGVFRRFRKNGESLWLQATYSPVYNTDGEAVKVVKLATDVSKREEANDLSNMVSRVQAVIEFDVEGNIKHANDLFLNAMGYELDEIKGKHHSIFMPPDEVDGQAYKDHWTGLAKGEFKSGNFKRRDKNGSDVWIDAAYNPVLDSQGTPVKVIKYATDITPRIVAVSKLREGLEKLARGDLSDPIEDVFSEDFEQLRIDYNTAISKLRSSLQTVVSSAAQISDGTSEITNATQDLSTRTEHQAAALDETSSAIKEMAASVKSTAETTQNTQSVVEKTKTHAASGSDIMQKARGAMGAIAESSDQISQITTMIEDIAFQTNLLALNAGVEAARAGDAGRGFAVVASEVRALALRSSEAATRISQLISTSTQQVEEGVDLVSKTDEALEQIGSFVQETVGMVSQIAQEASQQAEGIGNITDSLRQLEDVTQKNAAMFEETSAATKLLASESEVLKSTTGSFVLDKSTDDASQLRHAS